MSPDLPAALRGAIERELEGVPRKGLAERAARTSAAYRAGGTSAAVIREAGDALAYALARLPATYAACAAALAEAQARAPGFSPRRMLDAGSGTAAASWAAVETWPQVQAVTWLDASAPFLASAARLAQGGPAVLQAAEPRRADLAGGGPWPAADLVVASYALAEIAPAAQGRVVHSLWAACEGVLVLVEPGTPAGFARLLDARAALTAAGAQLLAPCPHAGACPLAAPDWCHFSIRLPRSRDHRLAKGAEVPFEDERFAYLVAARPSVAAVLPAARILAPPRAGKPGIELKLCAPEGLQRRFLPRREKPAHAAARRLRWGDAFDL
jgi:ribosomal protein RSM22 (predicted rRNA methylase)